MMRKYRYYFIWVALLAVVLIVPLHGAQAFLGISSDDVYNAIFNLLSDFIYFFFVTVMGFFATMASKLVVWAANLTGFTTLEVVRKAWAIVRDLSNMFFIVILLIIAFGTIFRIEAYSWKKLLPKMILAAILVNYSLAICGMIVDAAQVVTITFANAISDAAQAGLVEAFHLNKVLDYDRVVKAQDTVAAQFVGNAAAEKLLATVAAGLLLTVLVFVLFVYIVVLTARLPFIWFCTILAPLAFTCMVLPATEKYYKQWWDMFSRYVVVGPMILFFLWLSLFVAAETSNIETQVISGGYKAKVESGDALSSAKSGGALQPSLVAGFLISTMMLMAGLKIAQDSSSEIGQATGKALNMGKWLALGLIAGSVWKATRGAGKGAKAVAGFGVNGAVDYAQYHYGFDVNLRRQWEQLKKERQQRKAEEFASGYMKASQATKEGKRRGLFGAAGFYWDQYMPFTGRRAGKRAGGYLGKRAQAASTFEEFHQLKHDVEAATKKQMKEDVAIKTLEESPEGHYVKDTDRAAAIAKARTAQEQGKALTETDSWKNGTDWDLTDSGQRAMLESLGNRKQKEFDDLMKPRDPSAPAETADAKAKRLTKAKQLMLDKENITKALKDKKANNPANQHVDLKGEFNVHLTKSDTDDMAKEHLRKLVELQREAGKLNEGGRVKIGDDKQLAAIVQDRVAERTLANKELKDKIEEMTGRMTAIMPAIDDEATRQEHHVISEKNKAIETNDNEDYLVNVGQARLKGNDYMGVLAMFDHLAKVGHDNEIFRIFEAKDENGKLLYAHKDGSKIGADVKGFKRIAEVMRDEFKLDNDLIMSVMKNVSISAKKNNHWGYAEMIGSVGGDLTWRGDEEREMRRYMEGSKVTANDIARKGNRLAYGSYDSNGKFQLDPGIATLIAQNFHKFTDIIKTKNLFNSNAAEFLCSEAIAPQFEALIKAMNKDKKLDDNGENADEKKALELFKFLKDSTLSSKQGGFDPTYQVARGASAAHMQFAKGGDDDDHGHGGGH